MYNQENDQPLYPDFKDGFKGEGLVLFGPKSDLEEPFQNDLKSKKKNIVIIEKSFILNKEVMHGPMKQTKNFLKVS